MLMISHVWPAENLWQVQLRASGGDRVGAPVWIICHAACPVDGSSSTNYPESWFISILPERRRSQNSVGTRPTIRNGFLGFTGKTLTMGRVFHDPTPTNFDQKL
jgi:hypothetical protein